MRKELELFTEQKKKTQWLKIQPRKKKIKEVTPIWEDVRIAKK